MSDTYIEILPQVEEMAERHDYIIAICVIVERILPRTERRFYNSKSSDISKFTELLLRCVREANSCYPDLGYEKGEDQARHELNQILRAHELIKGIPENRRRSGLTPYMLDTLVQSLNSVVKNIEIYNTAQEHCERKELVHASKQLDQCQHPEAKKLQQEIQGQIEKANQLYADAERLLWQQMFDQARRTFEQGHAIFPQDASKESFQNTCRLAEQANNAIRDAKHTLQKCQETGTDEGLYDACQSLDNALVILDGLGAEAQEMKHEATDLKRQALDLRAKRAYGRYEEARSRRHLQDALEALVLVVDLDVGYADASERLTETRTIQTELQNAVQKARKLKDQKDLDGALKTIDQALSGDYDLPELVTQQRDIAQLQAQAQTLYKAYENACTQRDLDAALASLNRVYDVWPAYGDVENELANLKAVQQALIQAAKTARKQSQAGDLNAAEKTVQEALAESFDTPELKTLAVEIQNLKEQAEKAYANYEKALADGDFKKAFSAIQQTCGIWPTYRDAKKALKDLQKTEQYLVEAYKLADKKCREGDLESAEKIVKEALSGGFKTPDLQKLETTIADRKKKAADAFSQGQTLNAQKPRPVEKVRACYREAVQVFSHNKTYWNALQPLEGEIQTLSDQYDLACEKEQQGDLKAALSGFAQFHDVLYRDAHERFIELSDVVDEKLPTIRQLLAEEPPEYGAALTQLQPLLSRYPNASEIGSLAEKARRFKSLYESLAEAHQLVDGARKINPSALVLALRQVFDVDSEHAEARDLAEQAVAFWRDEATRLAGDFYPQKAVQLLQSAHNHFSGVPALRALAESLESDQSLYLQQIQDARQAFDRGKRLIDRREFGQARSELEKAKSLDADLKGVYDVFQNLPNQKRGWDMYLEGKGYEDSGDTMRAYDLYLEALKLLPHDAEIERARDRVMEDLGLRESFRLIGKTVITVLIGDHFDMGRNHHSGRVNDIVFRSDGISRTHGAITRSQSGWVYENPGRNVSDVNGRKLQSKHDLSDGDQIEIWDIDRAKQPIVKMDVRIAGDSVSLQCQEEQTSRVGNHIQFLGGSPSQSTYVLMGSQFSLGGSQALLTLKSGHAEFLWDGTCVKIKGQDVLHNEQALQGTRPIRDGDRLQIGNEEFRIQVLT